MTAPAERYARLQEVFDAAVELPPADRPALLERKCGSDWVLRREVEALLEQDERPGSFTKQIDFEVPAHLLRDDAEDDLEGRRFGPYEVLREIGRGGLGRVYLAARSDGEYRKEVAIKLIRRGLDTDDILRRFRNERQILAHLDHPNIARLIDGGTTDEGLPYFVMEFVEGEPISSYCEARQLNVAQRLELFLKVCAAVTYAHQHLVIHRDLKPSNIIVTPSGEPKLLDFGIAKLLTAEDDMLTLTDPAQRVLTPDYASPEQIRGDRITTATDVYSLGVLLYELLTGRKPYRLRSRQAAEISRAITDQEPERPSTAMARGENTKLRHHSSKLLSGDLDNIVLMAVRKEPARRYPSVAALAEDIRRHQEGLTVSARPSTFRYRAGKFVRRHRAGVAAAALVLVAIVGGIIATLWQASVARTERERAESRFNDVRSLAASFLFEFSPLMEKLPGSIPARELLVRRALEYLDRLSRDSGNDRELQRELATAYMKVGDVQGHPYNPNLGDIKGALDSYEKALAIRQRLWERAPANTQAQSELAEILKLIGDAHSNGGDYSKAVVAYDRAGKLRENVVAQAPADVEARAKLAETLRARGLTALYDHDNKRAIEFYTRARDINERLHREHPDNPKFAEQYAYAFVLIGEAQGWDNDNIGAAIPLQTGLDLLIALAEKHPQDAGIQHSLMFAHQKRAEGHLELKNIEQCVANFAKAVEIGQKLLDADPRSFQAKRDLALANRKFAQALDAAGNGRESLEKLGVALLSFEEMAAADPNNTEYPYDVANTRFVIGETHVSLGDHEAALQSFLQAQAAFEAVQARNPQNIYTVRMSSFNFDRMAKAYAALAQGDRRTEFLRKAIENWQLALSGFRRLKEAGQMAEYDAKAIEETEAEIAKAEALLRGD